jgi:hypothetical protein
MRKLTFSYENPVRAVFLRILAWEIYEAERKLKVRDVVTGQVQAARIELGLEPFEPGGGAQDFINKLRDGPKPLLTAKHKPPEPNEVGWKDEWRLLNLPSHSFVRFLSRNPVPEGEPIKKENHTELKISLRHPALPTLRIFIGTKAPDTGTFKNLRGVYFLRLPTKLYVGKSDEFHTRFSSGHKKSKSPNWWIFISPDAGDQYFTLDTLGAAESLLISFWNEIADLDNRTRGGDQKPTFVWLQQSVLLTEAVSAAFLWLLRDKKELENSMGLLNWSIPFKKWKGQGWPECYLDSRRTLID